MQDRNRYVHSFTLYGHGSTGILSTPLQALGALLNRLGVEGLLFPGAFVGREPSLEVSELLWGMSSLGWVAQLGNNGIISSLLGGHRSPGQWEKQVLMESKAGAAEAGVCTAMPVLGLLEK